MAEFKSFAKIARLTRSMVVTEKIDGTNAQVLVEEDGTVRAGSRTRWITPEQDNFGFAQWVANHAAELRALGPGRHFGEWWGQGIQRGYGLTEKRFSLFNVSRWGPNGTDVLSLPACCRVVPVLLDGGDFDTQTIEDCVDQLRRFGSIAAPGYMKPEGVVVFHRASGVLFKKTLEKDERPKGSREAA